MADTEHLARRLAELQRELDQLRSELDGQNTVPNADEATGLPSAVPDAVGGPSRRQLLARGAVAVGVGFGGAGLVGDRATAANGDPVKVGESHSGTGSTKVTTSGTGADALFGESTAPTGQSWGVRGTSVSPTGVGVRGSNSASTGTAYGVSGFSRSPTGSAVYGEGVTIAGIGGPLGTGGTGVMGVTKGPAGVAVRAVAEHFSAVAVHATNAAGPAIWGFSAMSEGVRGVGETTGGIFGGKIGGHFTGTRAAIQVDRTGPIPPSTSTSHAAGEVYRDDADDLWFCTKSGTPGTWFKLTAAGLSPVAPFRVYDSRFVDGPLLRGSNRLVSVRDSIDVVSGAVVKKNAVAVGARAVLFNVAVTNTVGAGFVAAAPGNASKVTAASINWSGSGETLNNGTFSQLDGNRRLRVFADGTPGSRTDVIIDVTGIVLP